MESHEVVEKMKESGWLKKLESKGVTAKDIEDAVYESKFHT